MYTPSAFEEHDPSVLVDFIRANSFGTVVSTVDGVPVATHLPVTLRLSGNQLYLRGHFARANPQWRQIAAAQALFIFSGPHAYVSPEHYLKRESVPTWNYLAVHAYGEVRLIPHDSPELEELLAELIAEHEAAYQARWDSLPERYREGMKQGVVGFEARVLRLEGAAKLSQNKTPLERARIAASLLASPRPEAQATGAEMKRRLEQD